MHFNLYRSVKTYEDIVKDAPYFKEKWAACTRWRKDEKDRLFTNSLSYQFNEILERRQNTLCDKIEKNFGIKIAEDDRVLIAMKNCFERLLFRNLFFFPHGEGPKRLHDWLHAILFEAFPVCRSLESRAGVQNFIVDWRRCPKFFFQVIFQRRSTANRINETVAVRFYNQDPYTFRAFFRMLFE